LVRTPLIFPVSISSFNYGQREHCMLSDFKFVEVCLIVQNIVHFIEFVPWVLEKIVHSATR
jgi:hypothetical protein